MVQNRRWDLKSNSPDGKYTYGSILGWGEHSIKVFASARDAGNFAAGAVAERSNIPTIILLDGFGAYDLSGNNVLKGLGLLFLNFRSPVGFLDVMPTHGEDPLSYEAIKAGIQNHVNYFWNSLYK